MSGVNIKSVLARFCENSWELRKDFVKLCRVKKRVGEGGERERALDDAFRI